MDSSVSEGATSLQTSTQKKKKSKNKKGPKGTPLDGLALETQTEVSKISEDRLREKFAKGLHLNSSSVSKIADRNAGEVKDRKISNSNRLVNGTGEMSISETCSRQLNGHDCNAVATPVGADSRKLGSNSTAEKQNAKKSKRKHKLKNKENAEDNCHNVDLVDQKIDAVVQESYEQTLRNGFAESVGHSTEEKGEGGGLVVPLKTQNKKRNKNIKKEITEVKDKLKIIGVQEDKKSSSEQAKEEQLAITSVPAPDEKATQVILTNTKEEIANALTSEEITILSTLHLSNVQIEYKEYESELQMHDIMRLIQAELSEPYSIYTYRYFIYNWPKLCFLAAHGNEYVGAIVCKLDRHRHMNRKRGYIAMLAVRKEYRKLKIGTTLVQKAIEAMLADNADEVVLETEMRNVPALRLYENLGFVRDKRLFRYYLNGVDALRLKLWFR